MLMLVSFVFCPWVGTFHYFFTMFLDCLYQTIDFCMSDILTSCLEFLTTIKFPIFPMTLCFHCQFFHWLCLLFQIYYVHYNLYASNCCLLSTCSFSWYLKSCCNMIIFMVFYSLVTSSVFFYGTWYICILYQFLYLCIILFLY